MSLTDRERSEKYTVSIPFTKTPKDAATGGIMKGQNLANLFSDLTVGYHDSSTLINYPFLLPVWLPMCQRRANRIPRREYSLLPCVPVWLSPVYFTPVRQDSMVLVDGGIVNNYPADVVKAMGADIIIGGRCAKCSQKKPTSSIVSPTFWGKL